MLGEFIRAKRSEKKITISELARASGVSRTYIRKLESNEIASPGIRVLIALAEGLALPLSDLLTAAGEDMQLPSELGEDIQSIEPREVRDVRLENINAAWPLLQDEDRDILSNAAVTLQDMRQHLGELKSRARKIKK